MSIRYLPALCQGDLGVMISITSQAPAMLAYALVFFSGIEKLFPLEQSFPALWIILCIGVFVHPITATGLVNASLKSKFLAGKAIGMMFAITYISMPLVKTLPFLEKSPAEVTLFSYPIVLLSTALLGGLFATLWLLNEEKHPCF